VTKKNLTNTFAMPPGSFERLMGLLKKARLLLIGVTGGIASGKTTVAHMLKGLGAITVDLDEIARQVVEPGKPAWKEIVDYFGPKILLADGHLDRKKLSKIVFQDKDKRKKLEYFTHPRIFEEFVSQVKEISEKEPHAIIQVVVPLLYELNMQSLFHRVLVVFIAREEQIERLIKRDRISREEAVRMLESQLPIDEKVASADFVIHNETSFEETRKEVEDLWRTLRKIQKERSEPKAAARDIGSFSESSA
jgi:dephospho-CoA kinase